MKYIKAVVVLSWAIGFGLTLSYISPQVGLLAVSVSALSFITYIVMRFILKYPDSGNPAIDIVSLITGMMSLVAVIPLFMK